MENKITIELSQSEAHLLNKALDSWIKEPMGEALVSSLMQTMLGALVGKQNEQEFHGRSRIEESHEEGKQKQAERESEALPLKARIVQAIQPLIVA